MTRLIAIVVAAIVLMGASCGTDPSEDRTTSTVSFAEDSDVELPSSVTSGPTDVGEVSPSIEVPAGPGTDDPEPGGPWRDPRQPDLTKTVPPPRN